MNTSPTFPAGNSLHGIRDVIQSSGAVFEAMETAQIAADPLQSSPAVQRGNRQRAKFVLDAIRPEDLPEFLADYLIARFGKVVHIIHRARYCAESGDGEMSVPDWCVPGAKLAVMRQYGDGYTGEIIEIEKVYKTGKFVCVGDYAPKTQWEPTKDGAWRSSGRFHSYHATLLAGNGLEKFEAAQRIDAAKEAIDAEIKRMSNILRNGDGEAILAAAAIIGELP